MCGIFGIFKRPSLVLGMRRLSIIDLEGGHQTMIDDGGNVFFFNGGIYNHIEQRIVNYGRIPMTISTTSSVPSTRFARGDVSKRNSHGMPSPFDFSICINHAATAPHRGRITHDI